VNTHFLEISDVKNICFEYARVSLTFDEPIPSFETRYVEKLESALTIPQRKLNDKFLYKTLSQQASVLFYEMIKLHPFLNGNKRIACVTLMAFLAINFKWLKADWMSLYKRAVFVAESKSKDRKKVLEEMDSFIEKGMVNYTVSIKSELIDNLKKK
jgi:death-on-curing protein